MDTTTNSASAKKKLGSGYKRLSGTQTSGPATGQESPVSSLESKPPSRPPRQPVGARFLAMVLALPGVLALAAVVAFIIVPAASPQAPRFDFAVRPCSGNDGTVQVHIAVSSPQALGELELFSAKVKYSDFRCFTGDGTPVPFNQKNGFIHISASGIKSFHINYLANIGGSGKHGHAGIVYNDLVTFSGEQILLLPAAALDTTEAVVQKSLSALTLAFDIPSGWRRLSPVPDGNVHIDRKTLYDLHKSAFVFGFLEEKYPANQPDSASGAVPQQPGRTADTASKGVTNSGLRIYFDRGYTDAPSPATLDGIARIYDYYAAVFGPLPGLSVVLLGKADDGLPILGGAASRLIASSFDPGLTRDWELLAHRMYHAFFDAKIANSFDYHLPPLSWLYEGLATYFENLAVQETGAAEIAGSMGDPGVSDPLAGKPVVSGGAPFTALFERYLYERLKDPTRFTLSPADEEDILSSDGATEFLHYTQAPLIVKLIEDRNAGIARGGSPAGTAAGSLPADTATGSAPAGGVGKKLLSYLIAHQTDAKPDLMEILRNNVPGDSASFIQNYIVGNELLPLWYLPGVEKTAPVRDPARVLRDIEDFDYVMWTWFKNDKAGFTRETRSPAHVETAARSAEKTGKHFASETVENEVRAFSPELYRVLMANLSVE